MGWPRRLGDSHKGDRGTRGGGNRAPREGAIDDLEDQGLLRRQDERGGPL